MRFHLLSQSAVRIVAIGGVTLLITAVYLSRFRPYALAGGRLWGDVTSHPAPDALTWNALAARVDEALTRAEMVPILSVEEGWEQSRKTCDPRPEQANGPRTQWAGITSETLFQKRQQVFDGVRAYFDFNQANISEAVNTLHFGSRRGIVYTGGNLDTLRRLYKSLRILRHRHKCTLPVEIFAYRQELEAESNAIILDKITSLGSVSFREARMSAKSFNVWKNWQIKGEAILESSFSEVLYLDSDNIPLTDPSYLFDHEVYKRHGAVFWPDFPVDEPDNPIWRMVERKCGVQGWVFESGQFVVNKYGQGGMNLAALVAANEMNKDYNFWYDFSEGDKDTFRYGFYFLDLPYSGALQYTGSLGFWQRQRRDGHQFCGLGMLQYGLSPLDWQQFPLARPTSVELKSIAPPIFVHLTLAKYAGGISRGDEIFTIIKHMTENQIVEGHAARTLDVNWANNGQMCVDAVIPSSSNLEWDPRQDGPFTSGGVTSEDVRTAYAGVLKDFGRLYWEYELE